MSNQNKQYVLPYMGQEALAMPHFPTRMQTFIFRNWFMVSKTKLAQVLKTTVENVEIEAKRMGLQEQEDVSVWLEKGYISIIRANWHLLNYDQLCELLGWSEEHLALTLKEEDFLYVKLGNFKPAVDLLLYCSLTEKEIEETKLIKETISRYVTPYPRIKAPFDFFSQKDEPQMRKEMPFENAVILDQHWSIENCTKDKVVDNMLSRFVKNMKKDWQVDLLDNTEKRFKITIEFLQGEEEYHELFIDQKEIKIYGVGSAGVLRGLYRLENMFTAYGGPYVKIGSYKRKPRFGIRYIHPYCGLFHTALEVDSRTYCPDELLEKYARSGINGLWMHAVLYQLSIFPYAPEISRGYEMRRKKLQDFINRAKNYGIKIYLYLNEPRSMPLSFFDKHPDMKGAVVGNYQHACLCTQSVQTREYLKQGLTSLCQSVQGLGGFFTITMSENRTHCKSHITCDVPCERCADKKPWELASDVNELIAETVHAVDENIKVIAWDWGWSIERGFEQEDIVSCIESLPPTVALMCNRESRAEFERGGIKNFVRDYSLSVSEISAQAAINWKKARETGHEIVAKTQINNTWECSTVPYLPVFDKIKEHMDNICNAGVDHLMLSWSLGGYPSANIQYISEYFFEENGESKPNLDFAMKALYGQDADAVREASYYFSRAFSEFPFDVETIYHAPQNCGVSNVLYPEPTGYKATMTCFPYDDLETWCSIYPPDIFEQQYRLICEGWAKGLEQLKDVQGEIKDIAYVSYTLFKSSYNQIRFVKLRDRFISGEKELKLELIAIIEDESKMAQKVYQIMMYRPEIGYEAANHYYYSAASVAEKMINCDYLLDYYKKNLNKKSFKQ